MVGEYTSPGIYKSVNIQLLLGRTKQMCRFRYCRRPGFALKFFNQIQISCVLPVYLKICKYKIWEHNLVQFLNKMSIQKMYCCWAFEGPTVPLEWFIQTYIFLLHSGTALVLCICQIRQKLIPNSFWDVTTNGRWHMPSGAMGLLGLWPKWLKHYKLWKSIKSFLRQILTNES